MERKEVLKQLRQLKRESDPRFREALTEVANGLENLIKGASLGGSQRAKKLSKKRRTEIAKKAAKARWGKRRSVKRELHNAK